MYGWIVDGISSLFEPVTGQNPNEWPGKGNVSENIPQLSGLKVGPQRQEGDGRPAKRNYRSVDVAADVSQSDQVEVKRRKRDVVISFVKKTVAGVAGLLRLRNPLTNSCKKHRHNEKTQPVTLMGIDELHTSWITSADLKMDKPEGGVNERGAKNSFQSPSPPLMRNYSATGLSDRGKERDRKGSLQMLPSRPTLRMGYTTADPICNGIGHNRCYKPSLTVEEAIKQNNKEHYRRLLEMVTEKYSKSQPLPFTQTKPQDETLSKCEHKTAGKPFESVSKKTGYTAALNVFTWKNVPAPKNRWGGLTVNYTLSGSFDDTQHVRCAKPTPAPSEPDLSTEVATRLNLVDKAPPAVSPPETHSTHTAHARYTDEDIPRLSKEMAAEVSCALGQSDPNVVLSAAFKLRITQRDLTTLQDGGWLNDEVMNFYLSLVMERSSQAGRLKVYAFSTFFFPKLGSGGGGQPGGHAAVKRWTKAVDLFVCDLVLVPLHLGVHWAMAVIDLKSKTVRSYDSMGNRHDDVCDLLLLYLKEEHRVKKGRDLDVTKWTIGSLKASEIPQQKNGSDCGVFACKYADYISKGQPLSFKQCHMPLFRKLMIWEILNQKLL
ncbi:sentrin-specific protease 2 [Sphaeramia orbicularis]|uniref:Sentrin-specific protease 2-like n=1 Tax=Sphaeramia orbicularis TaxID=375764 RepID=A0A673B880_9TELE|nr:sentrin-specific protease 2-like [Sphaeramia orbicularis]